MLRKVTLNPCARVENVSATSRRMDGMHKSVTNCRTTSNSIRLSVCQKQTVWIAAPPAPRGECHIPIPAATPADADCVWAILEPTIRTGETYTLPIDMNRQEALAYRMSADHEVLVVEEDTEVLGTYFLCANQRGGGSHVA